MCNGKMCKYEFLRKPDLSISLIHRTLHKKVIFSSKRSMVNEVSYQNIYGFSLKIFHIFGNVVHLTANTRFIAFTLEVQQTFIKQALFFKWNIRIMLMNLNIIDSLEREIFLIICLEITLSREKDVHQVR